ncbi:MAG: chromosomal replication initiator protein DnaA [Succiniclasticum sp.]|nr:chromosomal replication initiator protein DnaA [Succiniclasticum sp.]MDY6303249.1 chromosomal replication initiator protein DnaA [Succiniclasticum sp.]MDY6346630.1 chromosomal replication initiator protein DnaA [Succiniclasticum sp.]
MSQYDLELVWSALMDKLTRSTSEKNLSMYFRQMKPVSIEGQTLVAEVFSSSLKASIDQKFLPIMIGILTEITQDEDFSMEIRVAEPGPGDLNIPAETYTTEPLFADPAEAASAKKKKAEPPFVSGLNPEKRFDNFVVGNSNRFATAAAQAVVKRPGFTYNPLFIFGNSGLGKTHLMHATGNEILARHAGSKVLYVTCEAFTNEMIDCIKNGTIMNFQQKYRTIDCLIIDDIQFLENKIRTQEEFFHTFNALREANKQIIISSDRPPQYLDKLEERLRSRFANGLTIDIQPPDLETRIAILRKKAESEKVKVPNSIIQAVAQNIVGNIRNMEGALTRLLAYASLLNEPINDDMLDEVLKEFGNAAHSNVTMDKIIDYVCAQYEVKKDDILGKKRTKTIALPRQIAMYLCRTMTDTSLPRIGEQFGGRDHTTVMHAMDRIQTLCDKDKFFAQKLKQYEQEIRNGQ